MAMKRHRRDLDIISAINITNLLDTAFILLIAFMLVAPTLRSGIPVELPKVETADAISDEVESYTISIVPKDEESVSDRIYVNGKRILLEDLGAMMRSAYAANPEVSVTIESDKVAMAGTMIQVISVVNLAGIESFAFAADPEMVKAQEKDED